MTQLDHVLGVGIAKKTLDVELLGTPKPHRAQFANTLDGYAKLSAWLLRWKVIRVHACMEATGGYERALVRYLFEADHVVSVVNPVCVKGQAQSEISRLKTDRADAGLIARYCQKHRPEPWQPPAPEIEHLRGLLARLADLVAMLTQELNRHQQTDEASPARQSIEAVLGVLDEQIAAIEREIDEHINSHPDLKRDRELLESVPGIGPKTSSFLLVLMLRRFGSAREAAAFVGLAPRPYESGTSVRGRTRLSKTGSTAARSALYWPAIAAMRWSDVFGAFRDRLKAKGKHPMLIIAAMMRKLLGVAYGVLKSGVAFDSRRAAARL
jgi:transposase